MFGALTLQEYIGHSMLGVSGIKFCNFRQRLCFSIICAGCCVLSYCQDLIMTCVWCACCLARLDLASSGFAKTVPICCFWSGRDGTSRSLTTSFLWLCGCRTQRESSYLLKNPVVALPEVSRRRTIKVPLAASVYLYRQKWRALGGSLSLSRRLSGSSLLLGGLSAV